MRNKIVYAIAVLAAATLTACHITACPVTGPAGSENENPTPTAKEVREVAKTTSVVELPAKASEIVKSVPEAERERIAVRTLRIFLEGRQALAPALVGEIIQAAPETALAVVTEAVRLFPESAHTIARAASAVVDPDQVTLIALRAASAAPHKATAVSTNVRRTLPEQESQLTAFFSALQSSVDALQSDERVETSDSIIISVPLRIGIEGGNTPGKVATLLDGEADYSDIETYPLFEGVTHGISEDPETGERNVIFFLDQTVETRTPEIAETVVGQFDVIVRRLLTIDSNLFVQEIEYVE